MVSAHSSPGLSLVSFCLFLQIQLGSGDFFSSNLGGAKGQGIPPSVYRKESTEHLLPKKRSCHHSPFTDRKTEAGRQGGEARMPR